MKKKVYKDANGYSSAEYALRARISIEEQWGYSHIHVYLEGVDKEEYYLNNLEGLFVRDLRISCQLKNCGDLAPYKYRVEYAVPTPVHLADAKKMAKTLEKIEKGKKRLADKYGHPTDFAEYVTNILTLLGASELQYKWETAVKNIQLSTVHDAISKAIKEAQDKIKSL